MLVLSITRFLQVHSISVGLVMVFVRRIHLCGEEGVVAKEGMEMCFISGVFPVRR